MALSDEEDYEDGEDGYMNEGREEEGGCGLSEDGQREGFNGSDEKFASRVREGE